VTGERVSGEARRRRVWLAAHARAHVWAVSGTEDVWRVGRQPQVKTLLAPRATAGWDRVSAGAGAQGPRWSAWPGLPLAAPVPPAWRRWLVVRRSLRDATDLTASVVFAPPAPALETLVAVAGSRGTIAPCLAAAQGEVGLEHYAGRRGTGWERPLPWALGAEALWTVLRAGQLPMEAAPKKRGASPSQAAWRPARLHEDGGASECRCDAAPLLMPRAGHTAARRAHAGLVVMAPLASRDCHILARQTACSFISITIVLGVLSTVTGCYVEPTPYGTSSGIGAYQGESSGGGTDYYDRRQDRRYWEEQDGIYHPWNRPRTLIKCLSSGL